MRALTLYITAAVSTADPVLLYTLALPSMYWLVSVISPLICFIDVE